MLSSLDIFSGDLIYVLWSVFVVIRPKGSLVFKFFERKNKNPFDLYIFDNADSRFPALEFDFSSSTRKKSLRMNLDLKEKAIESRVMNVSQGSSDRTDVTIRS